MEPWAKRIRELLDEGRPDGLNEAGLAKACKAKQPSIWQWFNPPKGRETTKKISAFNAVRAARYLGTTSEYIITGHGPRRLSQDVEIDLSTLQTAIVAVRRALRSVGLELDAFLAAPLIAHAYRERLKLPRELSKADLAEFDGAIEAQLRKELGQDQRRGPAVDGGEVRLEEDAPRAAKAGRGR